MPRVSELVSQNIEDAILNFNTWGSILVNVKSYGAKGDGTTDDTIHVQSALAYAISIHGQLMFPPGHYLISDQLNITGPVKITGVDAGLQYGTTIIQAVNKPLFYITSECVIDGLNLQGNATIADTLQEGIFINNVNNVYIRNVFLIGFYNCVHIKDAVFFSYFDNVRFYSCKNALVWGDGTDPAGYQVCFNNCQATPSEGIYGFYFINAGTVTIDSLGMSPANLTGAGIVFESVATNAGIQQISNSAIEGCVTTGIHLIGTALSPIKFIYISNTYIYGKTQIDYAFSLFYDNCYLTSLDYAIRVGVLGRDINMNNCEFQTFNVPITGTFGVTTEISLSVLNPNYNGINQFIYLPFLTPSFIKAVTVIGGKVGTNARPIDLSNYAKGVATIAVNGVYAIQNHGLAVFSSVGGQTYNIPHGLLDTPTYVNVTSGSSAVGTAEISNISRDGTNIIVLLKAAPAVGTNNLVFYFEAKM